MCLFCDDPDLTADECLQRVQDLVTRDRFAIISVAGSRCVAEVSHTVGLTEHGAPELVVTGMRARDAGRLLRLWGDYLLDESAILAGETMGSGPWLMEAVQVTRPQDHLLAAHQVYGDRVRALQLAWADASGRWPWQPGRRARRAGQPLLGARAPLLRRARPEPRRRPAASVTRQSRHAGGLGRTDIDIDDVLVARVMARHGLRTIDEAVDLGLRRLVGERMSRKETLAMEGVGWDGDVDDLRGDSPPHV